mgnify:CR=1 FL=1|jgi:hypothetical protein
MENQEKIEAINLINENRENGKYLSYSETTSIPKDRRLDLNKGDIIYFKGEKKPYKIRTQNNKYVICTQNNFGDIYYTIIDWENGIKRAADKWHNIDFDTDEGIEEGLKNLTNGKEDFSQINWDYLRIDKIKQK